MNLEQEKTNRGPVVEECASGTSEETFHPFRRIHRAQNLPLDGTVGNRSPHLLAIPAILALHFTKVESPPFDIPCP